MDNRFKGVQKAHNKLIMACVFVIITGVLFIGVGSMGILLKKYILGIIWIIIGMLDIIRGFIEIRDANKEQYELENMIYKAYKEGLDKDLTRIREEINEITNELIEEEKCKCRFSYGYY